MHTGLLFGAVGVILGVALFAAARELAEFNWRMQRYSMIRFERKESWVKLQRVGGIIIILASIILMLLL